MTKKRVARAPEETRQKLLDAGRTCFARDGLQGASVHEIAALAGVTAAMINHHFGGKDGLYRACIGDFGARRLAALDRLLVAPSSRADFVMRLELVVTELFDLHLGNPEVVTILLRDVLTSEGWGAELEAMLLRFSRTLGDHFETAQKLGFLRDDIDARVAASVLYLSLSGFVQSAAHVRRVTGVDLADPPTRAALLARVLQVVLHGSLPATSRRRT
jgi:AcrR family transcriptional regulator